MRAVEAWRSEAGSYMYNAASTSGGASIEVPGSTPSEEPLYAPSDLDGAPPLRGWEAVASSYFLVQNATELHAGVPPPDFRVAYCLYDPGQPIPEQAEENAAGCSPRLAWDEWDVVEVDLLADVFGVELNNLSDVLTSILAGILGIDLEGPELTTPVEIVQEHPENRQLAIRQAQAGVARLALGPIVALFPLIEANISLMLALAASFLYLSLPIVLIFGFFLATESIVNRLLLQLINVLIRTLIINGLMELLCINLPTQCLTANDFK
jgi:hypothetical protein